MIGSAGSDDKVKWLQDELNFDHAFNYKTADAKAELAKFDPLNIYFDNVGGDQLEAALDAAANFARFIECGMISQYNEQDAHGVRNLMNIVGKRLKLQGFIVSDKFQDPNFLKDFYAQVPKWIANGELKIKEDVTKGLEKAPEAIVGIFLGKNFGKAVIQIADDWIWLVLFVFLSSNKQNISDPSSNESQGLDDWDVTPRVVLFCETSRLTGT